MSLKAVGIYLKYLMERQGLKKGRVKVDADVYSTYLWKLARGVNQDTSARLLMSATRAVGGSLEDVSDLLLAENVSENEAEDRARLRLEVLKLNTKDRVVKDTVKIAEDRELSLDDRVRELEQVQTQVNKRAQQINKSAEPQKPDVRAVIRRSARIGRKA